MAQIPFSVLPLNSYRRRVLSLYKNASRMIEQWNFNRLDTRYWCVQLRARFDCNASVCDPEVRCGLIRDGEAELRRFTHPLPWNKFCNSPGYVAHGRVVLPPDWVLDYWHPLEKAQYPEYFRRRECRKQEFVANWIAEYGQPDEKDLH